MDLYWTSTKTIHGLKHFVVINQYEFKKEVYLDFVSVLDESISFAISKKVLEASSQWINGWNDIERENIDIKDYLEYKSLVKDHKTNKIILNDTSTFNIS